MKLNKPAIFNISQHEIETLELINQLLIDEKYKTVIKETDIGQKKYPNNFFFYTYQAVAYLMIGDNDTALNILKNAENKFPESYEVLYQLAKVYEDRDDLDNAKKYYMKSYELTPLEYNDERSNCMNDLGIVCWKMERENDAVEYWKLALLNDPKNKNAKMNLKYFTDVDGKPITQFEVKNFNIFYEIQKEKYLKSKNQDDFLSKEDYRKVFELIENAWNKKIKSRINELKSLSEEEKIKLYSEIKINFDKKKSSKKSSKIQNDLDDLNSRFPFLPENGIMIALLAAPFLNHVGIDVDRLEEIFFNGDYNDEEEEMLMWAYYIGINLLDSVLSDDKEEQEEFLLEAYDIAVEYLDEKEVENALKTTLKAIKELLAGNNNLLYQ